MLNAYYTKNNLLSEKATVAEVVRQFRSRLKSFIRQRVGTAEDAEDVLQDVFYQLADADGMMKPVEQMSGWLYAVARNRIIDQYRKKRPELIADQLIAGDEDDEAMQDISDLLESPDDTPDKEYLKTMIWEEFERALSELPGEQRQAFELNEMQGMSFKEMAALTGETENTLISRKRYAVLYLRTKLVDLYDELVTF